MAEMIDRGQGTGVAGTHAGAGASLVHLVDGHAHGGVFLAADGLARLVIHRDDLA